MTTEQTERPGARTRTPWYTANAFVDGWGKAFKPKQLNTKRCSEVRKRNAEKWNKLPAYEPEALVEIPEIEMKTLVLEGLKAKAEVVEVIEQWGVKPNLNNIEQILTPEQIVEACDQINRNDVEQQIRRTIDRKLIDGLTKPRSDRKQHLDVRIAKCTVCRRHYGYVPTAEEASGSTKLDIIERVCDRHGSVV